MDDLNEQMTSLMGQRMFKEAEGFVRNYISCLERSQSESRATLATAYNWLGLCRYRAVEFDEAKQHYSTALDLNPALAEAYYNRGTVCYRMGESEAAVADMRAAVAMAPANVEFQQGLQSAYQLLQLNQAKQNKQ